MHIRKLLLAGATLVASLIFAAPAQADYATANVNVRSGPGTSYRVVDVLRPGQQVDITRQSGGWCYVVKAGPDGWVSCRYLAGGTGSPGISVRPDVSFSFSIPGFSFFIGDGRGFDFRPVRPDYRSQVCFYEHVNYGGDRFCLRPGQSRRTLGAWNDEISSIRVLGDAEALVCQNNNYQGRCAVIDRSVRNLGPRGNDMISSIRVR